MFVSNPSRICVCVSDSRVDRLLKSLDGLPFAEVRLDGLGSEPEVDEIHSIFAPRRKAGLHTIATWRPGSFTRSVRLNGLREALAAGADFVDLELEEHADYLNELATTAKEMNSRVIVSHHDNKKTPALSRLKELANRCFEAGAHIAKIACRVEDGYECVRLLSLLNDHRTVVPVPMGVHALTARAVSLVYGAVFTYAGTADGRKTAMGQPASADLETAVDQLAALCDSNNSE